MAITVQHNSSATRQPRIGYVVGASINVVTLYLVNAEPGWRALPWLTDDLTRVIGLVNLALIAGAVTNLVYLLHDPPWLTALGGIATTGIGLAALVRLLDVFPFAFGDASVDWATVARVVLVVGIAGSVIGLIVQVVTLVREAWR
jgi:hypothetical protein